VHELDPVRWRLRVEELLDAQRMAERYERIDRAVADSAPRPVSCQAS